ncbi:response regulator [Parasalinivibrio latis]|uniref:response regulator n=1 Tax=Parasalinivibrio latis TaxID=2952610 RepID=UPI0030E001AA
MLEKCLIVDDHEVVRETLALMTAAVGFKASIQAEDGAQAISLLFHQQPSFVITDLQMEPIDGLELLRLLRSGRFGLRHDLPIVILTANASEQVIAQCIAFDVDAFLVKPVSREALIERIKQLQVHPKIKKSPDYYFSLYQKDPAKSTHFQADGAVAFIGDDNEILAMDDDFSNTEDDGFFVVDVGGDADYTLEVKPESYFIRWQDKYSVGNVDLDDSNRQFVNIINQAYTAIQNHEDSRNLERFATLFNEYINRHIPLEEALLVDSEYQGLTAHTNEHKKLLQQTNVILLRCQAEPNRYKTDFFKLLRYWWSQHIVKSDTAYRHHLEMYEQMNEGG